MTETSRNNTLSRLCPAVGGQRRLECKLSKWHKSSEKLNLTRIGKYIKASNVYLGGIWLKPQLGHKLYCGFMTHYTPTGQIRLMIYTCVVGTAFLKTYELKPKH